MKNKIYISRRKFITYLIGSMTLSIVTFSRLRNEVCISNKNLQKRINLYNSKRENLLKNNLKLAIKSDLIENRTIWSGKKIYTYAELNYLTKK